MSHADVRFAGSIPEKYDTHLGPLFFEYYGADLAGRVRVPHGGRLLETACGTGISTEYLRAGVDASVEIVATDFSEPMLELARERRSGLEQVRFQQADASDLPFDDETFDAVVCQFGLMFVPDKPKAMREAHRVLRPGGSFVFNLWGSLDENPVAKVAHEMVTRLIPEDPPAFLPMPFSCFDVDSIRAMLIEADFSDIKVDIVETVVERPSAQHVAIGLIEGTPTIDAIIESGAASPEAIIDEVTEALANAFGDAPLRTPLKANVFSASRSGR